MNDLVCFFFLSPLFLSFFPFFFPFFPFSFLFPFFPLFRFIYWSEHQHGLKATLRHDVASATNWFDQLATKNTLQASEFDRSKIVPGRPVDVSMCYRSACRPVDVSTGRPVDVCRRWSASVDVDQRLDRSTSRLVDYCRLLSTFVDFCRLLSTYVDFGRLMSNFIK